MIIEQDCQIKTNFDFVTHSALMTFDNQTQQFGGKFEMSTYFYSNVIWLDLGSKILTLVDGPIQYRSNLTKYSYEAH